MTNANELSATEAVERIAEGSLTSESLVQACLGRIETKDGEVGAWEYCDPDLALAQATAADRGPATGGALRGVPVGVKDIFDTADLPTGYGSAVYGGHRPPWDASCVALLRAAGAVILGKTVTTEFAAYHPGKTVNPHNPAHTPGGSSSGSAAAVADFMVPLALGTQTAGSVIRPASFCGVVGYKPTFGWVNRAGLKPLAESLDTIGWFGRTVADAALIASVLCCRPSLADATPLEEPPRIGVCRTYEWPQATEATTRALDRARACLLEAGAVLTEISLPEPFGKLAEAQAAVMAFEAARSLAFEKQEHRAEVSGKLLEMIEDGESCSPERYDAAQALAASCRVALPGVVAENDALLVPSVPGEAPEGLSSTGDPVFNRIWTLLHVPCVNVPTSRGPGGLPVGLQLVGRRGADAKLLRVARWVEERYSRGGIT